MVVHSRILRSKLPKLGLSVALLVCGISGCRSIAALGNHTRPTVAAGMALTRTRPSAPVIQVRVSATEFKLTPALITVPAGQLVRLTFINNGTILHNWEAVGLKATHLRIVALPRGLAPGLARDMTEQAAHAHAFAQAGARQQAVIEFVPATAGRYPMLCAIPGHKELGMVGTLVVRPGRGAALVPSSAVSTGSQRTDTTPPSGNLRAAVAPLPEPAVAPPLPRRQPTLVRVHLEAKEVVAALATGVPYRFWTFDGTVPGPMIRVRQGDTVEVTLTNAPESTMSHSIDLHAATGPDAGGDATQVAPGQTATFRFKALYPGVYLYHCMTMPVAQHIANGMYGLIVVEPPGGFPRVDREFYVVEGEFYLQAARGERGVPGFSMQKMLEERPDYVVLNGSVGALQGTRALRAWVGEHVRIFFGMAGPNLTSSLHVIGVIFDRVHPEGASEALSNVGVTLVPAGGTTMVEFTLRAPGDYTLVDHSFARVLQGAIGTLHVEGRHVPTVFQVIRTASS